MTLKVLSAGRQKYIYPFCPERGHEYRKYISGSWKIQGGRFSEGPGRSTAGEYPDWSETDIVLSPPW